MKAPLLIAACFLLLSACSFDHMKDEDMQKRGGAFALRAISYAEVFGAVISPRCVSCHNQSGSNQTGINLETFESTSPIIAKIQKSVFVDRTMPKSQALTDDEAALLAAWIGQGATRNGSLRGANPKLKDGVTWTVIRDEVFASKCLECHSQPRPEGGLDLTSLSETKAKIAKIFDRAILTQDMPLEPIEKLTTDEKQALATWIALGMPE